MCDFSSQAEYTRVCLTYEGSVKRANISSEPDSDRNLALWLSLLELTTRRMLPAMIIILLLHAPSMVIDLMSCKFQ
jgi:hypothetical protein